MADLSDGVDFFHLGVLHPITALEHRMDEHVDVLVDRPGHQKAAVHSGSRKADPYHLPRAIREAAPARTRRSSRNLAAKLDDIGLRLPDNDVGVLVKPTQGALNGIGYRERRCPTERAYLCGVESNEWAIADPSPLAAGVTYIRRAADMLTYQHG